MSWYPLTVASGASATMMILTQMPKGSVMTSLYVGAFGALFISIEAIANQTNHESVRSDVAIKFVSIGLVAGTLIDKAIGAAST